MVALLSTLLHGHAVAYNFDRGTDIRMETEARLHRSSRGARNRWWALIVDGLYRETRGTHLSCAECTSCTGRTTRGHSQITRILSVCLRINSMAINSYCDYCVSAFIIYLSRHGGSLPCVKGNLIRKKSLRLWYVRAYRRTAQRSLFLSSFLWHTLDDSPAGARRNPRANVTCDAFSPEPNMCNWACRRRLRAFFRASSAVEFCV